jgi:hypothetical protein
MFTFHHLFVIGVALRYLRTIIFLSTVALPRSCDEWTNRHAPAAGPI